MRVCGFTSDDALAQAIGVSNSTVHRWKRGAQPEVTHLRQLVQPLRTDLRTLLVVSGTLTERELGGHVPMPAPLTTRDLLDNDPDLSREAREILTAAYEAAATAAPGLRAAARRPRSR